MISKILFRKVDIVRKNHICVLWKQKQKRRIRTRRKRRRKKEKVLPELCFSRFSIVLKSLKDTFVNYGQKRMNKGIIKVNRFLWRYGWCILEY